MNCSLSQDYSFSCDVGSGGVRNFWISEFNGVASVTESSGVITAVTKITGKRFYKYQLVIETANADEKINGNVQNGTVFFGQTIQLVINKQQVALRNEINRMALNTLMIVVEDNNGTFKLFGRLNGLRLNDGSANTGTAWADRNGYVLNFTGNERELAPFVDAAVIDTLIVPGA